MSNEKNDAFKDHIKRLSELRNFIHSPIINIYAPFNKEISEQKCMAFMIEGGLHWKTNNENGISRNGITLKSEAYDNNGKHTLANPITNYRQSQLGLYEISGTIEIDLDINDAEKSVDALAKAVQSISTLNATISMILGTRIEWKPARKISVKYRNIEPPKTEYDESKEHWKIIGLDKNQSTRISTNIEDKHIEHCFSIYNHLTKIPSPHKEILETSILWYCEGQKTGYEVMSFNSYWNAIEIIAFKYFNKLKLDSSEDEKKEIVLKIMEDYDDGECLKSIRDSYRAINASVKDKFFKVFGLFMDTNEIENLFFKKVEGTKYSLYDIRNYLSHGNYTEIQFEKHGHFDKQVYQMASSAKRIILLAISNIHKLEINQE